jgi:uncharacterized protein (DUF302 family)
MADYGRRIILDIPFEAAVAATSEAFRAEGFDTVSTLDVRDYLARHAHHECRRYLLLQAMLPQLTLDALQHDPETGPLLPATIAIFELADGETAVIASPTFAAVGSDFGWRANRPAIAAIADRAAESLARALDRLQTSALSSGRAHDARTVDAHGPVQEMQRV